MGKKKKKPTFYQFYIKNWNYFFFKKTSGFANTSLFTGDIDYVDMPVEGSYWILAITCMLQTLPHPHPKVLWTKKFFKIYPPLAIIVQGNTITLPSGDSSYAAIDTGTTLVGGPADVIAAIFAQIPGSKPGTGSFENYYTYRAFPSILFLVPSASPILACLCPKTPSPSLPPLWII